MALSLATAYEAGLVADDVLHGIRPTISGYRAWCGAGAITQFVAARFDLLAPESCAGCADLLRATTPSPRRAVD